MANGYLQTVQQGAYNSYQNMVDTAARLGALQEEYRQRAEAEKKQEKAAIRAGVAQAQVVGGSLGWQNLKDYGSYVNKTGDFTYANTPKTQLPTVEGAGVTQTQLNQGAIGEATGVPMQSSLPVSSYQYGTPIPTATLPINALPVSTLPTAGQVTAPTTLGANFNQYADTAVNTMNSVSPISGQVTMPVSLGSNFNGAANTAVNTMNNISPATNTALPATDVTGSIALKDASLNADKLSFAPSTTQSGEVIKGVTAGADIATAEKATEATTAATNPGAVSGAMAGIGGTLGLGLGAYSALKTGLSVGNVSSMLGGGLMLGSLMEGAAFLGPWGIGIGLAGGIASSVFGW